MNADSQTGGWVVQITTQRTGGADPLISTYYVALPNPQDALALVRKRYGGDDCKVETLNAVTQKMLTDMGMQSGSVRPHP